MQVFQTLAFLPVLFTTPLQIILFKTVCNDRLFPGYWKKEQRLHGLQNEWLMIKTQN